MKDGGRRPLAALIAAVLAAAVGCYSPEIGDGTLRCASGDVCPRGFSCGQDRRCWHAPDAGPAGTGGVNSQGGVGGTPTGSGGAVTGRGGAGGSGEGQGGSGGAAATGRGGSGGEGESQGGTGGAAVAGHAGAMTAGAGGGGSMGGAGVAGGSGGQPSIDGGSDASAKALGAKCDAPSDCSSGTCVDGVCCDGACSGTCEACDVTPGHCAPVTSGPPHGSRAPCGQSGACAGACTAASRTACTLFPGTSSTCRDQSCAGNTLSPAAFCDGKGTCATPAAGACAGNLSCNPAGTSCLTSCQHDADCVAPSRYCQASACTAARPPGVTCGSDGDCQSGHCVDGICCDLGCTGQCQACDVSGHVGSCWPIPAQEAPHGQRGACPGSGACGAYCNGSAATCVFPGAETTCPCTLLNGTCNGAGQCTQVGSICV